MKKKTKAINYGKRGKYVLRESKAIEKPSGLIRMLIAVDLYFLLQLYYSSFYSCIP